MYKLKKNIADFDVVDGPFAGRKFRAGAAYAEVPPEHIDKFEPARKNSVAAVMPPEQDAAEKPARGRGRKGGK